jgi:hypothetical protein
MNAIRVKAKYHNTVFGFNNSGKPLGQRDDLHILIRDAKANKIQYILDMFEEIPSDKELRDIQEKAFLEKQKNKRKR